MKMVVAIIQPTKLQVVKAALQKIGVERMTVCDALGYGRQRGQPEMYRGVEYSTQLLRKLALEVIINDDFLERTLKTIESVARSGPDGNIGDGKVFVLSVEEVIQIGGDTRGPEAV
ncbi:MAG: P-II family nitrogen regulator [Pirellulaceae bacterium]|nr:P-II family nitrogen regulator [Pirellulaceae bacterium]